MRDAGQSVPAMRESFGSAYRFGTELLIFIDAILLFVT